MDFLDPQVDAWLDAVQPPADPVRAAMEAEAKKRNFPIVGPQVGPLLAQLVGLCSAKSVFEMGSGYGYSTLWFAQAVGPKGRVVHTEGDPALSKEAEGWLARAEVADRVEFRIGDALRLLADDPGPYDVIFCDVDKHQYKDAWDLAVAKIRKGGLILFDNALWSGRVARPEETDDWTASVRAMVERAFADERFLTSLMPVRDGVLIARRRTDVD